MLTHSLGRLVAWVGGSAASGCRVSGRLDACWWSIAVMCRRLTRVRTWRRPRWCAARCASAHERCATDPPPVQLPGGGEVACWLHADQGAVRP